MTLKTSWMLVLVIPWRKARRFEQFTNTYEVTDDFGVRKSDFFYLSKNEKIVIIYVFLLKLGKKNVDETMTLR